MAFISGVIQEKERRMNYDNNNTNNNANGVCMFKGSAKEDDTTALIKLDSIQIVKHDNNNNDAILINDSNDTAGNCSLTFTI